LLGGGTSPFEIYDGSGLEERKKCVVGGEALPIKRGQRNSGGALHDTILKKDRSVRRNRKKGTMYWGEGNVVGVGGVSRLKTDHETIQQNSLLNPGESRWGFCQGTGGKKTIFKRVMKEGFEIEVEKKQKVGVLDLKQSQPTNRSQVNADRISS